MEHIINRAHRTNRADKFGRTASDRQDATYGGDKVHRSQITGPNESCLNQNLNSMNAAHTTALLAPDSKTSRTIPTHLFLS